MPPQTGQKQASMCQPWRLALLAPVLAASAWLMAVALGSPANWWLGWVTLVPLFFAIKVLRPAAAAAAGAVWGASLFIATGPDAVDGALPHTTYALWMLMLVPAVYAGVASEVTRRKGFHPLLLGLGWVGVELALKPVSIHHGLLAHTQGDNVLVQSVGHLGGYILVAFVIALVNGVLAQALCQAKFASSTPRVIGASSPRACLVPTGVFVLPAAAGLGSLGPRAPPA